MSQKRVTIRGDQLKLALTVLGLECARPGVEVVENDLGLDVVKVKAAMKARLGGRPLYGISPLKFLYGSLRALRSEIAETVFEIDAVAGLLAQQQDPAPMCRFLAQFASGEVALADFTS